MRFLALLEVFESRVIAIIVTQFTLLELLVVLHPIDKLISLAPNRAHIFITSSLKQTL